MWKVEAEAAKNGQRRRGARTGHAARGGVELYFTLFVLRILRSLSYSLLSILLLIIIIAYPE